MKPTIALRLLAPLFLFIVGITATNAADDFCWKDSYGRGVGTIPTGCTGGKENQNGLCYEKCPTGMNGVGPVCWSGCPTGYTDMGAICHINMPLTKSPEWVCTHWFPHWMGGACRWKDTRCPTGYTNAGLFCALTARPTPAGFSGTYLDPMKNTHARGAGTIPTDCGSKQNDAGLCYTACKTGYSGVGPVCWSGTPKNGNTQWVNCGMGNAKDSTTCARVITNQVGSVGEIALTLATFGGSAAAEEGAKGAEDAAKAGAKAGEAAGVAEKGKKAVAAIQKARETAKKATQELNAAKSCLDATIDDAEIAKDDKKLLPASVTANVMSCIGSIASLKAKIPPDAGKGERLLQAATVAALKKTSAAQLELLNRVSAKLPEDTELNKTTPADAARMAAEAAGALDPSGLSDTIAAYSYPKCSAIFK